MSFTGNILQDGYGFCKRIVNLKEDESFMIEDYKGSRMKDKKYFIWKFEFGAIGIDGVDNECVFSLLYLVSFMDENFILKNEDGTKMTEKDILNKVNFDKDGVKFIQKLVDKGYMSYEPLHGWIVNKAWFGLSGESLDEIRNTTDDNGTMYDGIRIYIDPLRNMYEGAVKTARKYLSKAFSLMPVSTEYFINNYGAYNWDFLSSMIANRPSDAAYSIYSNILDSERNIGESSLEILRFHSIGDLATTKSIITIDYRIASSLPDNLFQRDWLLMRMFNKNQFAIRIVKKPIFTLKKEEMEKKRSEIELSKQNIESYCVKLYTVAYEVATHGLDNV